MLQSIDPATGDLVREYPETSPGQIQAALELAERCAETWRRQSFDARGALLRRTAALLREREDSFAALMASEMGKPLEQGRGEIGKCAWVSEHFADGAASMLAPAPVATDAARSYAAFTPLGVVLAVMPWNFPFWQVFRFAAPALMAGNAVVLKHASNVSGCALAIESLLHDAGFPRGVFTTLLVGSDAVPDIIRSPHVSAVSLTGSTDAGRSVAEAAGRALKKTVLELGGSDPYIILEDADLDLAVETCAASRLVNGGQSCIAAKRFIATEPVRQEFTDRFVARLRKVRMGAPTEPGTEMGPLARRDLRDRLHDQVERSVGRGARLLLGGVKPPGRGAYYPATVLDRVAPGMAAYEEELFGPVAAVIGARDEREAVGIANDSPFGLGAAVFTRDQARGERIAAEELDAGACFVNAMVRSDPRLPFGGIKDSGWGRELSTFGIREFVNVKTVWVK